MIYFTSDQHINHKNIIEYTNRPFSCVEEMNEAIVNNFNVKVSKEDETYHIGDFTLNKAYVNYVQKLNGKHHLIVGNHDACFKQPNNSKLYLDAGFSTVNKVLELDIENLGKVLLNHFPYTGDSHNEARYMKYRPSKNENHKYLFHGHTHQKSRIIDNMIHVGIDAWDYAPVSIEQIKDLINGN